MQRIRIALGSGVFLVIAASAAAQTPGQSAGQQPLNPTQEIAKEQAEGPALEAGPAKIRIGGSIVLVSRAGPLQLAVRSRILGSCQNFLPSMRSSTFFVIRWMRTSLRVKSRRGGFWKPGGVDSTTFHQQVPALKTRLPLAAV